MAENCLAIKELSCAYGSHEVLHKLCFNFEPGKFYGLVGPNGSGKTTLLDHLIGHRAPKRGSIELFGKSIDTYPKRELARLIALVPQNYSMDFDFTVEEIVRMGRHPHMSRFASPTDKDNQEVEEAMGDMDIIHLRSRPISTLSGGEKQRVIAARALAQATPIIILDEATANLDIRHAIMIFKVICQKVHQQGCAAIAAIHNLNFAAAYCDEVLMLHNKTLAHAGPVAEMLEPGRISEVFSVDCRTHFDELNRRHQVVFDYQN